MGIYGKKVSGEGQIRQPRSWEENWTFFLSSIHFLQQYYFRTYYTPECNDENIQ